MAVRYKIKRIVNSASSVNGYYYPKAFMLGEWDTDTIAEHIEQNCTVKKSDVLAVISELVDVMTEGLQSGYKMTLNGFGSFKIGFKSKAEENLDDVTVDNIKSFHINFLPEATYDSTGSRNVVLLSGVKAQAYQAYTAGTNDNEM